MKTIKKIGATLFMWALYCLAAVVGVFGGLYLTMYLIGKWGTF